jgi:hypothetical protein
VSTEQREGLEAILRQSAFPLAQTSTSNGANRPYPAFPAWQGMQCMLDMLSGALRLAPLDNDRYAGLRWASLYDRFTSDYLPGSDRQRKEDL